MTVGEAWQAGRDHLTAVGVTEPGISAEVLLRHACGYSRTELYVGWQRPLAPEVFERYQGLLDERAAGRPVAYIVGRREFMGLDFAVDERVLIPRPETETLVETVLELVRDTPRPVIADIGTGSGAIGVSLAVLRPGATVIATDLSGEALQVAASNAVRHSVAARMEFLQGDLLEPLVRRGGWVHVVVCNPPYVDPAIAPTLPREVSAFEPAMAVVAPGHGASLHARLVEEAPRVLAPEGWLALEVAAGQAARVVELLKRPSLYDDAIVRKDLIGWERVIAARLRRPPASTLDTSEACAEPTTA